MSRTYSPAALAAETIEITRSRAEDAILYAEAYGHDGRALVIDGSRFSPSSRALPGGGRAWELDDDGFIEWDELVDDFIDSFELAEASDSPESAESWTLTWDDGCLWAVAPSYEPEA